MRETAVLFQGGREAEPDEGAQTEARSGERPCGHLGGRSHLPPGSMALNLCHS